MKKFEILAAFAACLAVFSCTKSEMDPGDAPEQATPAAPDVPTMVRTFAAEAEGAIPMKTTLNLEDKTVSWAEGDAVKVIYELDGTPYFAESEALTAANIAGGKASFSVAVPEAFNKTETQYKDEGGTSLHLYAVYPSSVAHDYSTASTLYVTVPSQQDGSFGGAAVTMAKWNKSNPNATLAFGNICAILKVTVDDPAVRKIEISSTADIAGKVRVSFNGYTPEIKAVNEGVKTITLSVPGAGTYYAGVIPTEITDLYVSLKDGSNNLIGDKSTGNVLKIARRQLCSLGTIASGFADRFYVKADGTGNGTSWDDAADYAKLEEKLKENTTAKIYMAAGTYNVTAQMTPGTECPDANFTILGGYPASSTGYAISGRDPAANETKLDAGGTCRIWILRKGSWTIDGLTFANAYRKGADTGSALVFEGLNSPTFIVRNCTFIDNKNVAYKDPAPTDYTNFGGGAVRVAGGTVQMTDCKFYGNTSDANGGAIFVAATGTLNATGCVFGEEDNAEKANTATVSGRSLGGCIYVLGTANLNDCIFASSSNTYRGGALALKNAAKVTISDCDFIKNTSKIGGAIYVASITDGTASLDVDNCYFKANSATGNGGGAVGISGDSKTYTELLTFNKCKFDSNTADPTAVKTNNIGGGAVWANGAGVAFTDCSFILNQVSTDDEGEYATGGGAVFSNTTVANRLFFDRCFFANNKVGKKRWGHHLCVASTTALFGMNNCVVRAPWALSYGDSSFKGIGSYIMSRSKTVIVNTTVFGRVGNTMITWGDADANGYSFINSIAINAAGTPNCFNNQDSAKYINIYYSLFTQVKDGSVNTTVDANSLSGVSYTDMGWEKDGLGTSSTVSDARGNFYYYDWSGTIDGKTVVNPDLDTVKGLISGTTDVGSVFLNWLGDENLSVDIRGVARNTAALWPGSYQN